MPPAPSQALLPCFLPLTCLQINNNIIIIIFTEMKGGDFFLQYCNGLVDLMSIYFLGGALL